MRSSRITIRSIAVALIAGIMLAAGAATPASAEPHTFYMRCTNTSGIVYTVSSISACGRGGYIRVYDTYDGSRVGSIDVNLLEDHRKRFDTWDESRAACEANWVCHLALSAAEAYFVGKVLAGAKWLIALLG